MAKDKKEETSEVATLVEQMAASQKELAKALIDSRKPFGFEEMEEQKKFQREQMKEKQRIEAANEKARQDACPHLRYDKTTTFWRREMVGADNAPGPILLICCRCEKQLRSDEPSHSAEFAKWYTQTIASVDIA